MLIHLCLLAFLSRLSLLYIIKVQWERLDVLSCLLFKKKCSHLCDSPMFIFLCGFCEIPRQSQDRRTRTVHSFCFKGMYVQLQWLLSGMAVSNNTKSSVWGIAEHIHERVGPEEFIPRAVSFAI